MTQPALLMKRSLISCRVLPFYPLHHEITDVHLKSLNKFQPHFHFLLVEYHSNDSATSNNPTALSRLTPGAYSNLPTTHKTNSIEDSLSLDISQLRQQYRRLKERNKQVQVMIQSRASRLIPVVRKEKPSWCVFSCFQRAKPTFSRAFSSFINHHHQSLREFSPSNDLFSARTLHAETAGISLLDLRRSSGNRTRTLEHPQFFSFR